MKFDAMYAFESLSRAPATARTAEALGFDGLWTSESKHEAFLPLPLLIEHSRRLQLGTAIAIAFARSPTIVAHTAWDLAEQSNGRFILGLGTQVKAHIVRRFGMTWEAPAPRLREFVLALRAIWDCWQNDTPLNFRGEHYKLTLMSPFFRPGPIATPRVPVYVAGVNPPLCRVAGEVADGFNLHPFHTAKYLREVIMPAIQAGAAKAGRSASDVQIVGPIFIAQDDAEREAVRAQLAFYASTPSYRGVLECHGWEETGRRLSSLAASGRWPEMAREVTDEMLETFAVVGGAKEVASKLVARYKGLVQRVWSYTLFVAGEKDEEWRALIDAFHAESAP